MGTMGLTASLYIGQSALAASQLALQVTGNNLANAATPGYHRQRVDQVAVPGQQAGARQFVGRGVGIQEIRRLIDPALQARLRDSVSAESASLIDQSVLSQIETITSATGDGQNDLSGLLTRMFNSFSEIANNPAQPTARAAVIEQGAALARHLTDVRRQLIGQRDQVDSQLADNVSQANSLLEQIASLNAAIINSEGGQGGLNGNGNLRDQRDRLLSDLGELMEITVCDKGNGVVDVLAGSTPIVLGTTARPLSFRLQTEDGELKADVLAANTSEEITINSGKIGALLANREGPVQSTIRDIDSLASSLIFEVNKIHALGRPASRLTDITGGLQVAIPDQTRALNDPANSTFAKLPFKAVNGSFTMKITDAAGNSSVTKIDIDLDGITNTGAPGTANDSTLASIVAAIDGAANVSATITSAGQIRITTAAGYDVSFADDTSGALAVLGVNSFFTGKDATDIGVRADLRANPTRLTIGSDDGKNEAALAIAGLRTAKLSTLAGQSLNDLWSGAVGRNAVSLQTANARADSLSTVRQSLEAQEAALSGVSTDEESINLITYQQQYQGAARFISVVNDMTQILLQLV